MQRLDDFGCRVPGNSRFKYSATLAVHRDWLQFDGGSQCLRGGILKHGRTNLPSTPDEGIYNYKIAAKFSAAVNSYSPSAQGA